MKYIDRYDDHTCEESAKLGFLRSSVLFAGVPRDAPVDSAVITVSVNDPDANSVGNIMYRITRAVFISNQGGDPRTASGM